MKIISAQQVHAALKYPDLIDALQEAFSNPFNMPPRQVHLLDELPDNHDAFALLPSWNDGLIGVKVFTYFPDNPKPEYDSLYSKILLFDRGHGEPLALVGRVGQSRAVVRWSVGFRTTATGRRDQQRDEQSERRTGDAHGAVGSSLAVTPFPCVMV